MSTKGDKGKGEQPKNDRPEGLSVDVDLFVSSTEVKPGPIHVRFRSRRGFEEGILILKYTIRAAGEEVQDEPTPPQRE